MSSKSAQSKARDDQQQQDKLIAVMLLETYAENFRPFSQKKAECLLPLLGNKTQLEHNINYLLANQVEEIYLFCTSHHQQIRTFLTETRLARWRLLGCEVHFIYNVKCESIGEAMREIDAMGLVRSNFILLTGSAIISNVKLSEYLELHKQVSKSDKNCVMTMICQQRLNDLSHTFNVNDPAFTNTTNTLLIHNKSNRILHYDQVRLSPKTRANKYFQLPIEMFQAAYGSSKQAPAPILGDTNKFEPCHASDIGVQSLTGRTMHSVEHLKTIQHRNDLVEAGMYLCSPYVLHMFTDNFDYNTMGDFVRGVLDEQDVAGYTVYIDIIRKEFNLHHSVVTDVNSYYFEMMRLMQRIDLILDEEERATYRRLPDRVNVYISKEQVKLGADLAIERNCLISAQCEIGKGCVLVNCFIGKNCRIGDNVKLANCVVWPHTQIGSDSTLNAAFLGFNVRIGKQCSLCENCLFASECHVKDKSLITERGIYF